MSIAEQLRDEQFVQYVSRRLSATDRAKFAPLIEAALNESKYDTESKLRDKQRWPEGDWNVEFKSAGRGFGKTFAGASWIKKQALDNPGWRFAILAPTIADARDTCVEGDSGLLKVTNPKDIQTWNRSLGEFVFTNGSRVKLFSGDEPNRLRGPQFNGAWVDELAAFRYPDAWDQLQFGLRLGQRPQVMVTTTPRPTPLIRNLLQRDDVHVTRGSTFDNAANLAPSALAELKRQYEGTRLGRQELYAELLTDVLGALWTYDMIERNRVAYAPDMTRITVNVDPSGGAGENHDEQGITVTGLGVDGHGYLMADRSCSLSPAGWAQRAVKAYTDHSADLIVVEKNYGGDMAVSTLQQAARDMGEVVKIKTITSSRGKILRAEPVSALFEQDRFHFVGIYQELEQQLTEWTPNSGTSPDRLDSLVFGATELMLNATSSSRSRFRQR